MTTSVHDALFKKTFSQVEHAAGELRTILPPGLTARIDFATLTLCPGSFVADDFRQRHTDLLFSAEIAGKKTLLYVLFEHQSTVDPLMLFRLLAYMVRIWEAHLRTQPDATRLPAIIPVVLHHSRSGWTADVAFEELIDVDVTVLAEIAPYVPHFRCVLDDLGEESEDALRARAMSALGRLALWCLKNSSNPEQLVAQLGRWGELVRQVLRASGGMAALDMIFRYMWVVNEKLGIEELRQLVEREIGKDVEEAIVNAVDTLLAEGRNNGLEQGRSEGQRQMLVRQLGKRFGTLPNDAVARVSAATLETLELWSDRVLTASTLSEVLGEG
jgi:predicted transposase/invertase (TIGR01784 family)